MIRAAYDVWNIDTFSIIYGNPGCHIMALQKQKLEAAFHHNQAQHRGDGLTNAVYSPHA